MNLCAHFNFRFTCATCWSYLWPAAIISMFLKLFEINAFAQKWITSTKIAPSDVTTKFPRPYILFSPNFGDLLFLFLKKRQWLDLGALLFLTRINPTTSSNNGFHNFRHWKLSPLALAPCSSDIGVMFFQYLLSILAQLWRLAVLIPDKVNSQQR